jgi:hypothetical protein
MHTPKLVFPAANQVAVSQPIDDAHEEGDFKYLMLACGKRKVLVSRAGLEPATTALKVRCSTN